MNKNIVKQVLLNKIKTVQHYSETNIEIIDTDFVKDIDTNANEFYRIRTKLRLTFVDNFSYFEINDYHIGLIPYDKILNKNDLQLNDNNTFIKIKDSYFKEKDAIATFINSAERKEYVELVSTNSYHTGDHEFNFELTPNILLIYDYMTVNIQYNFYINNFNYDDLAINYAKMNAVNNIHEKFSKKMLFVAFQ